MIALTGIRCGLHLPQQRIHLGVIQAAAGPHRPMTGHRRQHMRNLVLQHLAATKLDKLFGDITDKSCRIRRAEKRRNAADKNAALAKAFDFQPQPDQELHLVENRLPLVWW